MQLGTEMHYQSCRCPDPNCTGYLWNDARGHMTAEEIHAVGLQVIPRGRLAKADSK